MKIAILGWGSLLWDKNKAFDEQHDEWLFDGPVLKIEFSRVSQSRGNALTLVIDAVNGSLCRVAYTFSKRSNPDDVICDLKCREGTVLSNIGYYFRDGLRGNSNDSESLDSIKEWADEKMIDITIWTALKSNFEKESKVEKPYSLENALLHIQHLEPNDKIKAAEYVWLSPNFVDTPLRKSLQTVPWFNENS